MTTLPITEIVLYKHGVGFFVRRGETSEREITLSFRPDEINDVLKSLTVFDEAGGSVEGIHYQTPIEKSVKLADSALHLSDFSSIRDLIRDLRGRQVILSVMDTDKLRTVAGRMVGIESEGKGAERVGVLSNDGQVRVFAFDDIRSFKIVDPIAEKDLFYFLDSSIVEDNRRGVRVKLSEGEHRLSLYYTAPSPAWRVSYRLVVQGSGDAGVATLQGWGIFDNRLDEDLENVALTLVAGQPISFVYDLTNSSIPQRPSAQDDSRVLESAIEFDAFGGDEPRVAAGFAKRAALKSSASQPQAVSAQPQNLRELFAYKVLAPVSVKRGESALVPILTTTLKYQRELLYNREKHPDNPIAALRLDNNSSLTLERGPVTVMEDNTYKGDAIVPFSSAGQQVYLPYAVELGIKISSSEQTEYVFAGLSFTKDMFIENRYRVVRHTYRFENSTGKATGVVLEVLNERSIAPQIELVDMPNPDEETVQVWRWRVPISAKGISQWQYTTRQLISSHIAIKNLPYDRLAQYVNGRLLEGEVQASVRDLVQAHQIITQQNEKKERLEQEQLRLYAQQAEWRQTLGVLRDSANEVTFRARLLKQLEESENRATAIQREIRACEGKALAGERRIGELIEKLVAT